MWKAKHRARLRLHGALDMLDGKVKIAPDRQSTYNDDEQTLRDLNDSVYADLLLSMACENCFTSVNMARTTELSEGDVALGWKRLTERYEEETPSSRLQLQQEYNNCKLEKDEDPDNWITKMETYRWQLLSLYSVKIEDIDFLTTLLINLSLGVLISVMMLDSCMAYFFNTKSY